MRKVKIKERLENAVEAFFDNDAQYESSEIVLNNDSSLLQAQPEEETVQKLGSMISLVKQVFLFLPGAFFIYKLLLTFTYITFQKSYYIEANYSYHLQMFFINDLLIGAFFLILASFMTYVGVGSLRETKNLVVPGAIVSFTLLLSILFSFLPEPVRGKVIMYYSAYLFPLVLIVAGSAKYWIEENEKGKN